MPDLMDRAAASTPGLEALVDPPNRAALVGGAPRRLSWSELQAEARHWTALLYAHGLRKDDVLLVQLPNTVELVILYLAAWRLGIMVTPLPVQHREKEAVFAARQTGASAIVTARGIAGRDSLGMMRDVQSQCPAVGVLFALGAGEGAVCIETALAGLDDTTLANAAQYADAATVTAHDVATICWTSGTEAEPKGVPRNHNEWLLIADFQIDAAELSPGARMLAPFPLVNMSGIGGGIALWLRLGGALILHHPFDLDIMLGQLRTEGIQYTVTAPAVLTQLLNHRELLSGIDFQRLSRIGSGSAPLSEWMVRSWRDDFGVELVNTYGSNEGAGLVAARKDVPDPAARAIYFPRFGVDGYRWKHRFGAVMKNRLVDPDSGEEITAAGKVGELRIQGPTVFAGYWNAPQLTQAAFEDGWFRTGDLFEIAGANNQYFRFVGRLKDIVLRGGQNISCEEIEGYLCAHPDIDEAAIVGAPDAVLGERICACVVFRAGAAPAISALNDYLRNEWKIAVYKQLERIEVFAALPRNPVGKILKRELRDAVTIRLRDAGESPP